MILLAATALLLAAEEPAATFGAGAWEGQCVRTKKAGCAEYQATLPGPVSIRFVRTAAGINVTTTADDCAAPSYPAAVNPAYSAMTMSYIIRGHVVIALHGCKSKLAIPALEKADLEELLRLTANVVK